MLIRGFPGGSEDKASACNAGDLGLIPELGRSPGEAKGYTLQHSGLENSIDCIVYEVTESAATEWLSLSLSNIKTFIRPHHKFHSVYNQKLKKIKDNQFCFKMLHEWYWWFQGWGNILEGRPNLISDVGASLLVQRVKNPFESVLMRWMKLEPIIQSEVSQKEKHQYSILMRIYGI